MKSIAIDIETAPSIMGMVRLEENPPEFEPPKKYKYSAKIAEYIENKKTAWREGLVKEASLDPDYGRVVSIAMAGGQGASCAVLPDFGDSDSDETEKQLLVEFWRAVSDVDRIITWNGHDFDLRFLIERSTILGVSLSRRDLENRYPYGKPHLDLMRVLAGPKRYKSLAAQCRVFGISVKSGGMTGADVAAYVDDGRWEEIREYNAEDATATWEIYQRLRAVGRQ